MVNEAEEQITGEPEPEAAPPERAAAPPAAPRAGPGRDQERPIRRGRGRRRVCIMCAENMKTVDYKDASFLRRFLSDRGRIDTRRKTSCCAKHQRALAQAIKRARHLALLPYTPDHIRGVGVGFAR